MRTLRADATSSVARARTEPSEKSGGARLPGTVASAVARPCAMPISRVAASTNGAGSAETKDGKTNESGESGRPSFVTPVLKRSEPETAPSDVKADATTRPVRVARRRNRASDASPGRMSPSAATGSAPGGTSSGTAPVRLAASKDEGDPVRPHRGRVRHGDPQLVLLVLADDLGVVKRQREARVANHDAPAGPPRKPPGRLARETVERRADLADDLVRPDLQPLGHHLRRARLPGGEDDEVVGRVEDAVRSGVADGNRLTVRNRRRRPGEPKRARRKAHRRRDVLQHEPRTLGAPVLDHQDDGEKLVQEADVPGKHEETEDRARRDARPRRTRPPRTEEESPSESKSGTATTVGG